MAYRGFCGRQVCGGARNTAVEPASFVTQARTSRRATWTAQGDYLLVLLTTPTPCQRHRRAA
eukprot:1567471-Prymnesium_polylepis.1